MKITKIKEILDRVIKEVVNTACRSSDGYGEGSFPIKLTQRQAEVISDYLNNEFDISWDRDKDEIDPKAVYLLWVSYDATNYHGECYWGLKRVTESPDRR